MADDSSAPPVPIFAAEAEVCGNCKLWRPHSVDHRGWVGPCRMQESRGLFPPSAPICDYFAPKGSAAAPPKVAPERVREVRSVAPLIVKRQREGAEPVALKLEAPAGVGAGPVTSIEVDAGGDLNMTRDELIDIFREASGDLEVPLAAKWEGGHLQLVPGKPDAQAKELPIDAFFHKVVMVRDRLRTLEQKINAHPKLSDAEKVDMQQYITRVYGSLTSFNVLFRDRSDQFVGAKSDD